MLRLGKSVRAPEYTALKAPASKTLCNVRVQSVRNSRYGVALDGRAIKVNEAIPKTPRDSSYADCSEPLPSDDGQGLLHLTGRPPPTSGLRPVERCIGTGQQLLNIHIRCQRCNPHRHA